MSFDDWFLNQYKCLDDEKFDSCEDAWNAGAQSRQAEIDELRKRIKKSIDILNKKPNELTYNDAMYAIMELKGTTNEQ